MSLRIFLLSSFSLNNYEKVLDYSELAIKTYPNNGEFWLWRGDAYYFLKKRDESLDSYKRSFDLLVKEEAEKKELFNGEEGELEELEGVKELIIEVLQKIIRILMKFKNYQQALQHIEKGLKLYPGNIILLTKKGNVYMLLEEYDKSFELALEVSKKVEDLIPNADKKRIIEAKRWAWKGHSFYHEGDVTKAIECYQRSLKINPENFFVWKIMGNIYHIQGNIEKALEYFKRALKISPNNKHMKELIQNLKIQINFKKK